MHRGVYIPHRSPMNVSPIEIALLTLEGFRDVLLGRESERLHDPRSDIERIWLDFGGWMDINCPETADSLGELFG